MGVWVGGLGGKANSIQLELELGLSLVKTWIMIYILLDYIAYKIVSVKSYQLKMRMTSDQVSYFHLSSFEHSICTNHRLDRLVKQDRS